MSWFEAKFPQHKEPITNPVAADYREAARIYRMRGHQLKGFIFARTARRLEWVPQRQINEAAE